MNAGYRLYEAARHGTRSTGMTRRCGCGQFRQNRLDDLGLQPGKVPLENLCYRTLNDFLEFLCHAQRTVLDRRGRYGFVQTDIALTARL